MVMTDFDIFFKVILIGENTVKKKLINFLFPQTINSVPKITLGIDFYPKEINHNGKRIKLMIWNPVSADKFYIRLSQFLKNSHGALIVCDRINSELLEKLAKWNDIIRKNAGDIPIILIRLKKEQFNSEYDHKEVIIPMVKNYITDYFEILVIENEDEENIIRETVKLILNHHIDT